MPGKYAAVGRDRRKMTESEKAKGYHLEWMTPEEIVKANEPFSKEPWIYRDTAFIKMLMEGNL